MATFEVKYNKLDNYAKDIRSMVSTLKRLDQDIDSCRSKISTSVSSANYSVRNTLSRISNSFMDDIKAMEKMAQVLDSAHDLYKTTEKNITKIKVKIEEPERAEDGAVVWDAIVDGITGFFGEMGAIGGAISGLGDSILGYDTDAEGFLEVFKYLAKTTGAFLGELSKDAPDWISVLTGYSDDAFNSVKDYFAKLIDDLVVGSTKTASKIGSVVANWASVLVEGVINFVGNMEEFGEGAMGSARFWGETITETVLDLAKVAAVGAAVVAIAGSAPAWGVALISGGVVALVDAGFEYFTGDDLTEIATDGLMDLVGLSY